MRFWPIVLLAAFLPALSCNRNHNAHAVIHTSLGDIRVRLYDDMPEHRDFFLDCVASGTYDSLLAGRIERDFVIQSSFSQPEAAEPDLPEPDFRHPLLRGALGANGSLFFIVQGRPQTDASLDRWEKQTNRKIPVEWRTLYKQKGGAPQLEGRHSVFGEVVDGLEVVDRIAALPRDAADRPLQNVWMRVER
jgi:peptidyl-prolyl cis-trans isomerase B (cyclophilin B)